MVKKMQRAKATGAAKPRPAAIPPATRQAALAAGERLAAQALLRREGKLAKGVKARAKAKPGTLVAEGDSWFDYPLADVLEELEDEHGWDVVSVAHHGDTVESMAYSEVQIAGLERALRKVAERQVRPKAILLSGGGNDIAGEEFPMLLNHALSGLPPLNESVLQGAIDERLSAAIVTVAAGATVLCEQLFGARLPILIHGYDYPVPDGRGFLGGLSILPGPWLEPGFRRKGYDDLAVCSRHMRTLMDRFNALVEGLAGSPGLEHLRYVKLLGTLSSELPDDEYKAWWGNELHPTRRGFQAVAKLFDGLLRAL